MPFGGVPPSGQFHTVNRDAAGVFRVDYEEARGDVSGVIDSLLVIGLRGGSISPLSPVSGQVLSWNGAQWTPTDISVSISGHDLLSITHSDTVPAAPSANDLIAATTGSPSFWAKFPGGPAGTALTINNSGNLEWSTIQAQSFEIVVVTSGVSYTVPNQNQRVIINKTIGSSTQVVLPLVPSSGQEVMIKDGKGDANMNNITVTPSGSTIDGNTSVIMRNRYQAMTYLWNGTEWNII